ncbi:hypothetical protein H8356DRAFT_152561 [Neocallimastix lanati (nom. inval.)]|nr:hypothetical protein H8356DRAFT_152561 [Neocallimastix sp. JGI-2020a]
MKITGLFYLYFILAIINFSQALRCGEKFNNKKCPENQCCSYLGYCGRSKEYCDASYGCQSEYGRCSGNATTTTTTTTTLTSKPTTSNVIHCGPDYDDKMCPGDACCSESGQCSFDLESCGVGCQKGYGFCLPTNEFDRESCLECEDCLNCDESPIDKLLCPKTCFKNGNKRNETIEIEPCTMKDNELDKLEAIDLERLCSECNKCIDCSQFPDIAKKYPNACKRVSTDISTDGTCGPQYGNKVCPEYECCDESGHCASSQKSCGRGCQAGYGNCLPQVSGMCIACINCSYCDNEFDSLYCPSTCFRNPYESNLSKIDYKLKKYERKTNCPNINKLCYQKISYGGLIALVVN